jgi:UDP:flavonoid glycosyltransferase YjiC (YdhE family)
MAPKFVFSGTGTRGDLLPMLAMAAEMQRRGHDCHVLANDPSGAAARELGVPFTSTAPAQTNNLTGVEGAFGNHVFPAYRPTFAYIEAELARGSELVLVNPESYAASTLMAERHGLPLCRYTLAPFRIFSLEQPFYPLSVKVRGRLGVSFRRYTLPRLREQRYTHPFIVGGINQFRAELGLAPIASVDELERLPCQRICMFPDWYCAPASDWPKPLECVGFPLQAPAGALPDDLGRFIDAHGAPLVFTPGTGVADVEQFFAAARRACELLDRPGVFLSPNLAASPADAALRIVQRDYLDLALILPRAALLVHHGGIGTTARALEAGVPQIISPQAFDQPDNGDRVTRLGVGAMLARERLTGETLAEAARPLLDEAPARARLAEVSLRVRSTNAIAALADLLERRFVARTGAADIVTSFPTPAPAPALTAA